MIWSKNGQEQPLIINLNTGKVDEIKEFCYLGNIISKDGRNKRNGKFRISLAKKTFSKKND